MDSAIARAMERYGSTITLVRSGEQTEFRGFLQHSGSKSWQNMRSQYGPLGQLPGGQYVLVAPVSPGLLEGDTLVLGDRTVVIRRLETVMRGDRAVYQWGLCEQAGGEDTWGSRS